MEKDDKILENVAIEIRNRKKGKICLTLASGPQPPTQPPSDDESLIMVSSCRVCRYDVTSRAVI